NRSLTRLTILFTHQMRHLSRLIRSNTHPNATTIQLRQAKCARADRAMRQIQHLDRAFRTQEVAVTMIANRVVDTLHDASQHRVGTCGEISDCGVTVLPTDDLHGAHAGPVGGASAHAETWNLVVKVDVEGHSYGLLWMPRIVRLTVVGWAP